MFEFFAKRLRRYSQIFNASFWKICEHQIPENFQRSSLIPNAKYNFTVLFLAKCISFLCIPQNMYIFSQTTQTSKLVKPSQN